MRWRGGVGVQDTNSGYLVLMKHDVCDVPLWEGETKFVKPTAETTISLSQIEVGIAHLYLVSSQSFQLV